MDLNGVLGVLALLYELDEVHGSELDLEDLDWEAVYELDTAAKIAVEAACIMEEEMERDREMEEERRGRRGRSRARRMEAARDASVMLGRKVSHSVHKHRRGLSTMSDYFDAIGEDEHIENDEHDYQYGSIFSTLATHHNAPTHNLGHAMQDWHTRLHSPPPTFYAPSISVKEPQATEFAEVGQAMKEWHARTRMKRRGTGRGMDIVASSFDLGEWEFVLGKMVEGWEESVLAFVLLVVMFRLWLLDAFGGRI